ncbi:MAG TPA: wax ester/triacylglycerol synthase domain-containing protein [Myxococcales bacterium]|nr:wax ester/triacylglycerol synthase domain-containing protein [Myxococcales bacterium]
MTPTRETMAAADAAWLQMDTPENRMIITSLMDFDAPLDPVELERMLEKLAAHPRFHRRVVAPLSPLSLPYWEDDPRFDLRAHVRHVGLPAPGGDEELQRFVSERMSVGLPPDKPLWELDVIDKQGGTALLLRVHHCVGDGVALVRVLLGLAEAAVPPPKVVGRAPPPSLGPLQWLIEQASRAKTLVELLALSPDPRTLRARLGLVKRAAWSRPIRFAAVQELAKREGATVNDVLMGALAGALRDALSSHGAVPEHEVRALVPLYLRGAGNGMGNHFGLVFVQLPIAEATREARLRQLRKRMGLVKASPTGPLAFEILRAFGAAGAAVERIGVGIFTDKASLMVTNVAGPQAHVRIAGQPLHSMMTWAPTSGHMAMSVSLLSYAGELRIGICADANLAVDPSELVRAFEHELVAELPEAAAPLH